MSRAALDELTFDGEQWMVISYTPARPPELAALTASELAVMERWVEGLSIRRIALERGVSTRTIANQIASIYAKFGVGSRSELVTLLHDLHARTPRDASVEP